jgi:AcrR family transcriptional regulator
MVRVPMTASPTPARKNAKKNAKKKAARPRPGEKRAAAQDLAPVELAVTGRERWLAAATEALLEGGLGAVAVEPLAASMRVTKGSFYWHFTNKDELIRALVQRWEELGTDAVIAGLDAIAEPRARLDALLSVSFDDVARLKAEGSLAAAAARGDAIIAPVVARVMKRRLDYTERCYAALGVTPAEAKRMAVVAYGAYLGCVQLAGHGLLGPDDRALRAQVRTLQRLLVPA